MIIFYLMLFPRSNKVHLLNAVRTENSAYYNGAVKKFQLLKENIEPDFKFNNLWEDGNKSENLNTSITIRKNCFVWTINIMPIKHIETRI